MQIHNLSEVTQTTFRGVIYGAPGVGKTTIACSLKDARIFVFDIDKGLHTARVMRAEQKLPLSNVKYATINNTLEFEQASLWLWNNLKQFDLIVIDTATELQRMMVREVCKLGNVLVPGRDQWGIVREMSEKLLVDFRNLDKDVVYLAHEAFDSKAQKWTPSFDGRFSTDYAKLVDYIGRYVNLWDNATKEEKDETAEKRILRYAIQFGKSEDAETKDRSKSMQYWELPDLDNILLRMRQAVIPPSAE